MVSPPEEGGIKETRYADNNIIISDSTLRNIISPQLNNMSHGTRLCVVLSVSYLSRVCFNN